MHAGDGSCGLTFELMGVRRCGAWPARRMMTASASRAKCHAGARPLERRVRPHLAAAHLGLQRHSSGPRLRMPAV